MWKQAKVWLFRPLNMHVRWELGVGGWLVASLCGCFSISLWAQAIFCKLDEVLAFMA